MGFDGAEIWPTLAIYGGKTHCSANEQAIRMNSSEALFSYSPTVSNVISVLKLCKYEEDLRSSATLQMATEKFPPNPNEKQRFSVDGTSEDRPNFSLSLSLSVPFSLSLCPFLSLSISLLLPEKRLSRMSSVY